jgi:hypothetical protein
MANSAFTAVRSVIGTSLQIDSSGGTIPEISIDTNYPGQGSFTELGIIVIGEWEATPVGIQWGGTGATDAADALTNLGALPIAGGTMTGALILNADPTNPLGAVTKEYADAISAGLTFKDSCYAASTANLNSTYINGVSGVGATLTNAGSLAAFSIDSVSPALNARILIKNQSTAYENGIYSVTTVGSGSVAWILTRTTDYDNVDEIQAGDIVLIDSGTVNANTAWVQTATVTTIGTSSISFSQFGNSGTVTSVSGTSGQIDVANGTSTPVISIDSGYVGQTSLTTLGTITTGTWEGSVIPLAYGGTNANLTASNGGIFYSTASAAAILSGTATAHQVLVSGASGAPSWVSSLIDTGSDESVCLGTNAGINLNGNGNANSFFGFGVGLAETNGTNNCGFGAYSLYSQNGANGNTAVGYLSGEILATGNSNTLIGYKAGGTQTSYSECTFLGYQADASTGSLSNATAIGYNASVGQSNSLILGHSVNVGIGTSTPNTSSILELASTTGALLIPRMTTTQQNALTAAAGMILYDTTSSTLNFYNGAWVSISTSTGTVTSVSGTSGQIDVATGTTTPVISIDSGYVGQTSITTLGTIGTGTWHGSLIPLAYGGTNADLTASNGGIFYSTASAGAILAGTATADQVLLSGASGAPSWSTATYPATTTINQILYSSSANVIAGLATANNGVLLTSSGGVPSIGTATVAVGGTGNTTFTAYSVLCAGTTATGTFQNVSGVGTSGQVLTSGGASALPTWQNPSGGLIVNQNSSSVTMAAGNQYYINNGSTLVTLTLPSTAAQGDTYVIVGGSSGGWKVGQNSGQQIHLNSTATTTGTGGSLASTNQYNCINIKCITANTTFVVFDSNGSITVV